MQLQILRGSATRTPAVCIHEVISQLRAFEFCQASGVLTLVVAIQLIQMASNLAELRYAIEYLKRPYSVATAEANFSDDIAGADVHKENLAVLQLLIKTLQHAYGIVAISTTVMENPEQEAKTVQRRPMITRSR
jgi:hypothetical protein